MKIPKQLFVVSRPIHETAHEYDSDGNYVRSHTAEIHKFGFLQPHDSTKADEKRKETQLDWAYSGRAYKDGDIWKHKGVNHSYDYNTCTIANTEYDEPIAIDYAPVVWDNIPIAGFKIIDTVCRYRGNKLFKVMDPRGIEFEITAVSLFNILMNGSVQNGLILNACVWKANKNLVIYT